jgi:hypothetical protein
VKTEIVERRKCLKEEEMFEGRRNVCSKEEEVFV